MTGALTLVQFTASLRRADIVDLRTRFGLSLTDYVPGAGYLELLDPHTIVQLQNDPRVQSCVPHDPSSRVDPSSRHGLATDNAGDESTPIAGAAEFRATLVDDADVATSTASLVATGARDVRVLDDRDAGGRVRIRFRLDDGDRVDLVAALADVVFVEPTSEMKSDGEGSVGVGAAWPELTMLWGRGLHGEAQIIAMLDNGPLDLDHCFFADDEPNEPGPQHRKVIGLRNASGTAPGRHPTFVAGCAVGDARDAAGTHPQRGVAWAARLFSGNRNDLDGSTSIFNELTEAMAAGAFIHTNSWHFDTGRPARYTQDAADVDNFTFLNEDHLVLGSAGNAGEEQGPPGTAKNAVCVGAAQSSSAGAEFGDGNPGPTADGRVKPDLLMFGCDVESALKGTPCGSGKFSLIKRCATSFATPRVAATAALVRQYFVEGWHPTGAPTPTDATVPSGALLKAVLLSATAPLIDDRARPSDSAGWGVVRLDRTLAFADQPRRLHVWDVRHAGGVQTGDERVHDLVVPPETAELRVALVWTDPAPAPVTVSRALVNQMRLLVTSPRRVVHAGIDGAPVAVLTISDPEPGPWQITLQAEAVNVGRPGQGYALVAFVDGVPAPRHAPAAPLANPGDPTTSRT